VASAAPALAAPGKGSLNAFRDSNALPAESTQKAGLAITALNCQGISIPTSFRAQSPPFPPGFKPPKLPTKKKVRIPSFRAALKHAGQVSEALGVKKVLKGLKKARSLRTEGAAHEVAVAALLGGSPRLALAGLLVANDLDPGDRMNLVNAAAPLAMLGKPADAIALINHADKMRGTLPAVMGVSGKAVLENNRGYAYAKLKDHPASIKALKKALVASPAMAEANTNLAAELVCAGRNAEALKYLRAGAARSKVTYVSPVVGGAAAIADQVPTVPIASQVADLSAGQDGTLPSFVTPSSASAWVAFHPQVAAMNNAVSAALGQAMDERTAALEQTKQLKASPATTLRASSFANLVNTSHAEPELIALHETALAAIKEADTVATNHWAVAVPAKSMECQQTNNYETCFEEWCKPATASANGSFNSAFTGAERTMRAYWRVAGKRETGLAANLSQPSWHTVAMSDVRSHAAQEFGALIPPMQIWTGGLKFFEKPCVTGSEQPPAAAGSPTVASPGMCPEALQGYSGSFGTEIKGVDVSVSVSCSSAEIEVSQGVAGTGDLISVFGKGERDFKTDSTTIVVGAKGDAFGLATGQSGLYITTGKDGITDYGWRVGAGASAGGLREFGGTENISFVGAIGNIGPAFGFGTF
jgi:tetratricopeptide (TPR) repeat protein